MNININAAALVTQPAKPAPVGPKAGPSSPERSSQGLTHQAHRTGENAHKVRSQAHKARPFKEHVQDAQRPAEGEQAPSDMPQDGAKVEAKPQSGAKPQPGTKPETETERGNTAKPRTDATTKPQSLDPAAGAADARDEERPESDELPLAPVEQVAAQNDVATPPPASDAESERFVQGVVSKVMQTVDPALRFNAATQSASESADEPAPTADARPVMSSPLVNTSSLVHAAGAVSVQAAKAMRAEEDHSERQPVADGDQNASLFADEQAPAFAPAASAPHQNTPTTQAASPAFGNHLQQPQQQRTHESADKPGEPASSRQPGATVDAAARAVAPDASTSFAGGRVTLTPGLSVAVAPTLSVPAAGFGSSSKAARSGSAPTLPPAQQVQQAFEVAMRDLPTPAGERLVTLKMNPVSLGSLRIALHVSGENVQVRFQVGSGKARAAIDESMDDLKAAVERQGLRITSVEVEEDRALAAPGGVQLDNDGRSVAPAAGEPSPVTAGKGFAQLLDAPPGASIPERTGADTLAAETAGHAGEGAEGGVLQVLTFRLDAVA